MKETLKKIVRPYYYRIKSAGKPKVFGIGRNKTGTTSLTEAMRELGFVVGVQKDGAKLIEEWAIRDFRKIIKYCHTGNFFQDIPFSLPYTYIALDHAFPNSKFILTVRDNPEKWYTSLINYEINKMGKNKQLPTIEDLKNFKTYYGGNAWRSSRLVAATPEDDPYNKEMVIDSYLRHNKNVMDYFHHRPDDLLVLNVAEKDAYKKLCDFLGKETEQTEFPWKNKSSE